jgi:predicted double-glycine peptidase
MTSLLITLLALSLAVVIAGFFLSYKPEVRSRYAVSTAARAGRRVVVEPMPVRARRAVERQPLRTYHVPIEVERHAGLYISKQVAVERISGQGRAGEPIPWKVITVGLVALFLLSLYALNILLPRRGLWSLVTYNIDAPPATATIQRAPAYNASQHLVRLSQLDPGQYNSAQEYNLWAYSTCSAAALTEVINTYGHHYRVTDILKVEAKLGEITPQLGLLEEVGIQRTAAQFGFQTAWGHKLSLDQIITIANHGHPVIVSFPPDKYAGGHLLVVTGGNGDTVYLADSSLWNRQSLSRAQFLQWWEGFAAIVVPN